MNLMNIYQKTIVEIMGMATLEHPVFYKAPVSIRFEIGGEENIYIKKGMMRKEQPNPVYVNQAVERALTIFHALPKKDWLLRIDLYDKKEIKETVKQLQLVEPQEKVFNEFELDGEKMCHYELYWSLNEIDWSDERILREIILADIGGINCLASAVTFLQPYEKILFHLYDDRGLDVAAKEKSKLYSLYERFNDWILDYDREAVDRMFKNQQNSFDLGNLLNFLNHLEDHKIYYKLNKIRKEALMVEIVLPGQRWEVEFLGDGRIEVEKFISDRGYYDEGELDELFREFSD